MVNNETGDHIACNAFGKPIPPFHPGVSGVANTKERLELELKVRPARARRPVQGRKRACLACLRRVGLLTCLAFAAWWQDVKWEKSLQKKAPPRPPPLAPELLQERVSTTGRFGGKTPGEIDLHPSKAYTRALARSSPCGHPPPQRPHQLALGCPQAGRGVLAARAAKRAAAAP